MDLRLETLLREQGGLMDILPGGEKLQALLDEILFSTFQSYNGSWRAVLETPGKMPQEGLVGFSASTVFFVGENIFDGVVRFQWSNRSLRELRVKGDARRAEVTCVTPDGPLTVTGLASRDDVEAILRMAGAAAPAAAADVAAAVSRAPVAPEPFAAAADVAAACGNDARRPVLARLCGVLHVLGDRDPRGWMKRWHLWRLASALRALLLERAPGRCGEREERGGRE